MAACSKCDTNAENSKLFTCDSCNETLCATCSNLSASELKCMPLKNRKLKFLCEECEKGLGQIPLLIKQMVEMREEINQLKLMQITSVPQSNVVTQENFINEMLDRQNRRSNIIMLNLKESQLNSKAERSKDDIDAVKVILNEMSINKDNVRTFRLGKYENSKNRPLKVILNSPEDALYVLKNKKSIKVPSVKVFGDQTKMQRDYFLNIKRQLNEMIDKGDESKTIKYINNVPTIVDKPSQQQQKNRK